MRNICSLLALFATFVAVVVGNPIPSDVNVYITVNANDLVGGGQNRGDCASAGAEPAHPDQPQSFPDPGPPAQAIPAPSRPAPPHPSPPQPAQPHPSPAPAPPAQAIPAPSQQAPPLPASPRPSPAPAPAKAIPSPPQPGAA